MGLVTWQQVETFLGGTKVEYCRVVLRLVVSSYFAQHFREAVNGVDGLAVRTGERADGVERTINQGISVKKKEGVSHCRSRLLPPQKNNQLPFRSEEFDFNFGD
jgi:hypothetical protein